MQRESWTWASTRLSAEARIARWGHFGTPVLLFPTGGGDFEEVERFNLIDALRELINHGRIKVFSVDGLAARTWLQGTSSPEQCAHAQSVYDAFIDAEVVPLIRRDCHSDTIEILAAGAALGACSAVSALCRLPHVFRGAIGLSGVYDLSRFLMAGYSPALQSVLPVHALRALADGPQTERLRQRFVLLATGEGDYEVPGESERMAAALNDARVQHSLEKWGHAFPHTWSTWRDMLPRYVATHA